MLFHEDNDANGLLPERPIATQYRYDVTEGSSGAVNAIMR
jgi:hypothetical protein